MGFGVDLQGRASHEALLKVQDAEIKLLELAKRFLLARVEADKQYAASLTKMLAQATKGDTSDLMEFQDCCSVFRAWDTQLKETESFIKLVKENSEVLASRTLDSLSFLIAEKKTTRRSYLDQRNQLDSQMTKHQEEVQKAKTEYTKLMERLKVDRAKYLDTQNKGKAGTKLEDSKAKMVRTMNRLHQQHNDYVLAVQTTNGYQENHFQRLLPSTLDCHQCVQELYVRHTKFVLQDLSRLTDFTLEPFKEVSARISQALDKIEPDQEYGSPFVGKYKSDALSPIQFEFDQNIMEDYSGPLKAAQLELDDLTYEALCHRRTKTQDELKAEKKSLEAHQKKQQELSRSAAIIEQRLAEEETAEAIKELIEQKKQEELEKKQAEVSEATVKQLEKLYETIDMPLSALGDATPPSAFEATELNGDAIMFQGFHGGDNIHYARIYNVFVEAGCCQDPDWFSVVNHKGINPDHPHCSWTVTGMTINPNLGAAVGNNATDGTLTTPLIRATSPGETDCLTFEYFLSYYDGNSLTACIMDTQNVFRPVWTMSNKNNTGFGELELLKGQIPVSSSAFKIRFTGRREVMTDDAIVAIRNVRYTRGSTKAQCSLMPLGAFAPANLSCIVSEPHADQGHSNAGAITGGVIVAVLIVLAIAIGGFIFWRRRNKQRDHQETDPHNSPDTATPLPHADEPIVSPENYERLNAVSEQREYAVLQAAPRQPTDSTYYELPSGEGPAVAGTAGRNPNYQNLPVPENGLSDTANAGSAEGGDGSNNDYLTPVLTMPAAVNTASK